MRRYPYAKFSGILFAYLILIIGMFSGKIYAVDTSSGSTGLPIAKNLGDGKWVLANNYVYMEFVSEGGRCISFKYLPDNTQLAGIGGLFEDHVAQQGYPGDFYNSPATVMLRNGMDDKGHFAEIYLRLEGKGEYKAVEIRKWVRLYENSPLVYVRYEMIPTDVALEELVLGFWQHHDIAGTQAKSSMYWAGASGVTKITSAKSSSRETEEYCPSRPWLGKIVENQTGIAFLMEYPTIKSFYTFYNSPQTGTLEWKTISKPVSTDKPFDIDYLVIPFEGLSRIDGVSETAVGQMILPERVMSHGDIKIGLKCFALQNWTGYMQVSYWPVKYPARIEVFSNKLAMQIGKDSSETVNLNIPYDGEWVIRVDLLRNGKSDFSMERPVGIGTPIMAYKMQPLEQRGKDTYADDTSDIPLTNLVVTEHVVWSKPLAAKEPMVLALCDGMNQREVVELAQRFGGKYDSVYFNEYDMNIMSQKRRRTVGHAMLDVADKLDKNPDVLVIGGTTWTAFPDNVRKMILSHVNNGMGLVYIAPRYEVDDALEALIGAKPKTEVKSSEGTWNCEKSHFITKGIPWSILPKTHILDYPAAGDVLATCQGKPLLMTREVGKGRVVVWNYCVRGPRNLITALTPYVDADEHERLATLHYWEYQLSLLARSIYWAGKRAFPGTIQRVSIDYPHASITLVSKQNCDGKLFWRKRNSAWEITEQGVSSIKPISEQNININFKEPLSYGANLVEFIWKDIDGKVVDWYVHDIESRIEPFINNLNISQNQSDKKMQVNIKGVLQTNDAKYNDLRCKVTLEDFSGKKLDEVEIIPQDKMFNCYLSGQKAQGPANRIVVSLFQGKYERQRIKDTVWLPVKKKEGFNLLTDCRIVGMEIRPYLADARLRALKNAGINAGTGTANGLFPGTYEAFCKSDMQTWINIPQLIAYPARSLFGGIQKKYRITRNPNVLVRTPCLSNEPEIRKILDQVKTYLGWIHRFQPVGFLMAHECSLMGDPLGKLDFCYCYRCRARYYKWLEHKYGTIENLRKLWGKFYKNFTDVPAATVEMARDMGLRSEWMSYREFQDECFTEFWKRAVAPVREAKYPVCMMADSCRGVFQGIDYEKLADVFDYIMPYPSDVDNIDCLSFGMKNKGEFMGYAITGDKLKHVIYSGIMRDAKSLVLWWDPMIINPDYTITTMGKDAGDIYYRLKNGLGNMLAESKYIFSQVAVYYSQQSMRLSYLEGTYDTYEAGRGSALGLLRSCGYNPRSISDRQILSGQLDKEVKILSMVQSRSIPVDVAEKIDKFVQNGNIIIVDTYAGKYDEFGRTALPSMQWIKCIRSGRSGKCGKGMVIVVDWSKLEQEKLFREQFYIKFIQQLHLLTKPLVKFAADGYADGWWAAQWNYNGMKLIGILSPQNTKQESIHITLPGAKSYFRLDSGKPVVSKQKVTVDSKTMWFLWCLTETLEHKIMIAQ